MPKATQKSVAVEEEGDDPHGVVNPLEAKAHTNSLDQVMTLILSRSQKVIQQISWREQ